MRAQAGSGSLATNACIETAGAGLAGISRGFSRPAPIAIWSSKVAKLENSAISRRAG
jgi:hypothetical protein